MIHVGLCGFPAFALAAALQLAPVQAWAQLRLITDEEARAPAQAVSTTRGITRGPGVRWGSPAEVKAANFAFRVLLEPRGGASIDPKSLRVEYLKQPPIDLTERVRPGLKGHLLELPQVTVPVGQHPLRVTVRDSEGREGSTIIQLTAR